MSTRRRVVTTILSVVAAIAVFVTVFAVSFFGSRRETTIGAHRGLLQPTADGHVTIQLGALLPDLRLPSPNAWGLGARLHVQGNDATSINQLVLQDAVIAAHPAGEAQRLKDAIAAMAADSALRAAGLTLLVGVVVLLVRVLVGRRRCAELRRRLSRTGLAQWWNAGDRRRVLLPLAAGVLALVLLVVPTLRSPDWRRPGWQPLASVLPAGTPIPSRLASLEIESGLSTNSAAGLIRSAVDTYTKAQAQVDALIAQVPKVADAIRQPGENETVSLMVSDRHNNIGIDEVAAEIGRAATISLVIDAGDDTSSGQGWEEFSINSLATRFKDIPVVAIAGNHDHGGRVLEWMTRHKFNVLSGKPKKVAGIWFVGDSDPNKDGLGTIRKPGDETLEEQSARLADVACEQTLDRQRAVTLLVHDPAAQSDTVRRGCARLALSGHYHRQVGPEITRVDDRPVTTYTNGTTGGAAYAFALGYTLRRDAQVTLITYADGVPVGVQPINLTTSNKVEVQPYIPLPAS